VKYQWVDEWQTVFPGRRIEVLSSRKPWKIGSEVEIAVINWDILSWWVEELKRWFPASVIADEAHFSKNRKARRSIACKDIMRSHGVKVRLGLTGSPMPNGDITELLAVLDILGRLGDIGGWTRARGRYGVWEHNGFGWTCKGVQNEDELNSILKRGAMVRRRKQDVIEEMPDKVRTVLKVDIDDRKGYDAAKEDVVAWVRKEVERLRAEYRGKGVPAADLDRRVASAMRAEALVRFGVLRRLSAMGKMKQAVGWVVERAVAEPVLVFVHHKEVGRTLEALVRTEGTSVVRIDGGVTGRAREAAKADFVSGRARVLVASIEATGTGLDGLQKASSCAMFLELPWSPGKMEQAEGRVWRVGQARGVQVYCIIGRDTIDEYILRRVGEKQDRVDAIVDGVVGNGLDLFL
jgi:SWI/SNF-related matrix-associated actin-dependent regulator 1 of chromatin subfamily A